MIIRAKRNETAGLPPLRKAMCHSRLIYLLTCTIGLFLVQPSLLFAQADEVQVVKNAEKQSKQPTNSLQVQTNIPDTARVHALLMPPHVVAQVFGKRVAQEYGVVEVDIFNLSKDSALMIGDISVDYSHWIFANCPIEDDEDPKAKAKADRKAAKAAKMVGVFLESPACEVSSQEVRAVRQIALEGQRTTWRNRVSRYLRGLGIAGNALGVANLGKALAPTMSSFTNGLIPGFEFAFPDETVDQINLLNDLAYRVNTVVPQESPKVVMAFFPMRRFLGSYFWQKYLDEPALFFSPMQYYLDPNFNDFFEHIQERAESFYKAKARTDLLLTANGPLVPPLLRLTVNQLIDQVRNAADQATKDLAAAKLAVLAQAMQSASGSSLNDLPVVFQMKASELVNALIAANADQLGQARENLLNFAMGLRSLQPLRGISEKDPKRLKLEEDINELEKLFTSNPPPAGTTVYNQAIQVLKDADAIAPGTQEFLCEKVLKDCSGAQIGGLAKDVPSFLSQLKFFMAQPAPTATPQNGADSSTNALDISDTNFTLNAVHIKVDAKFVTNVDNVAAQIDSVSFNNGADTNMGIFSAPGHATGSINGHFLDKGTPHVTSSDGLDHGLKIAAVAKDSNAELLNFELTWTDSIPSGTGLIFTVTKTVGTPAKGQTTSNGFTKQITYPDFVITATPTSQNVTSGGSTSYIANVAPVNGFTASVTLSVSGQPNGVTPPPPTSTTSGASTLTLTASATAPPGTYTLTITGTSGNLVRSVKVTLVVKGPDFTLTATPPTQTVKASNSTSYIVTLAQVNGFTGTVTFSVTGQPGGVTAPNPPPATAGDSTLSVSTTSAAPAGKNTLTITGTSGNLVHSATVTLEITGGADFTLSVAPGSQTVSAGGTAPYTASIKAVNGFAGTVNFSAEDLPTGASFKSRFGACRRFNFGHCNHQCNAAGISFIQDQRYERRPVAFRFRHFGGQPCSAGF